LLKKVSIIQRRNVTKKLWLVGMPSDELEQDIEAWQRAERILDGLVSTFQAVRGNDAAFVALMDTKVRIKQHAKRLDEDKHLLHLAEAGLAVLARLNAELTEAAELLEEAPPEAFASEEDYFRVKRAIAEAGQLVACAERRIPTGASLAEEGEDDGDEHYEARAELEAWEHARSVLMPLEQAARQFGSKELDSVMREALGRIEENLARARGRLRRAEEAAAP
jgi:hypothetical protein